MAGPSGYLYRRASEPIPSVITVILLLISFYFFAKSMKMTPIGTAYAAFAGIGAGGTSIIGMIILVDDVSYAKFFLSAFLSSACSV
ncbi:SMR family transporter [Rossellomorea vietnamensis]|uniref:SMR family transporter n=1 Tax=Rossellomorea TaxID=2837508 RepID=UPI00292A434F|nr:SMR family transporter [Rossellomorea aquimaris]